MRFLVFRRYSDAIPTLFRRYSGAKTQFQYENKLYGRYPNNSRHVRLELDEKVEKGALAKELAKAIIESGGLIDESDLANQETMLYENPPSI